MRIAGRRAQRPGKRIAGMTTALTLAMVLCRCLVGWQEAQVSGVTTEMVRRWRLLTELQDRNEALFYK